MASDLLTKLSSRSNTLASACLVLAGHELLNGGRYEHLAILVGATVVLTVSRHIRDMRTPAAAGDTDDPEPAADDYDRVGE